MSTIKISTARQLAEVTVMLTINLLAATLTTLLSTHDSDRTSSSVNELLAIVPYTLCFYFLSWTTITLYFKRNNFSQLVASLLLGSFFSVLQVTTLGRTSLLANNSSFFAWLDYTVFVIALTVTYTLASLPLSCLIYFSASRLLKKSEKFN